MRAMPSGPPPAAAGVLPAPRLWLLFCCALSALMILWLPLALLQEVDALLAHTAPRDLLRDIALLLPMVTVAAAVMALLAWTGAMVVRTLGRSDAAQARLAWFLGFGLTSWVVAGLAALAGFYVAGMLDDHARAALLFVNPLYYALLLAADVDKPAPRRAIICGSAAAGLTFILPSSAGLLAAGIIGGTIAFFWGRARGKR